MPTGRFSPQRIARHFASLDEQLAPATRSGFLLSDALDMQTEVGAVLITGILQCQGGIRIEIEERLEAVRQPWVLMHWLRGEYVKLVFYRYNAVLWNRGTIFRYNSPHDDHRQFHHVHRFDVLGTGAETVEPVAEQDVPSLRDVLREAEDWYWAHLRKG